MTTGVTIARTFEGHMKQSTRTRKAREQFFNHPYTQGTHHTQTRQTEWETEREIAQESKVCVVVVGAECRVLDADGSCLLRADCCC